jgi:hypothetical protein
MMAGFVYIMSNPAFPNLLKIGKSKKDPTTDRVNYSTRQVYLNPSRSNITLLLKMKIT